MAHLNRSVTVHISQQLTAQKQLHASRQRGSQQPAQPPHLASCPPTPGKCTLFGINESDCCVHLSTLSEELHNDVLQTTFLFAKTTKKKKKTQGIIAFGGRQGRKWSQLG